MVFGDHHAFTERDVGAIVQRARQCGADVVLTTAKDVVRLLPHRPIPVPVAWVPMELRVEPDERFRALVLDRVKSARTDGPDGTGPTRDRPRTAPAGISPVLLARWHFGACQPASAAPPSSEDAGDSRVRPI
jgi:hypothetical protein